MPEIRNTFLAGKMNKDADNRLIPEGQYRHAENIRIANSEGSDVGAIEKSLSNAQLTTLALGANVKTLGTLSDEFEEKIYWAIKSDSGCYVVEYDAINDTEAKVLEDTRSGSNNVLAFDETKLIQMVLIVDSDNGNRLLAFTDNNTQPKCINVERAKTYGINGFNEEAILLIKKPPLYSPTIVLDTTGDEENNIDEKFLVFFARYKYLDGEYSALSPASSYAFKAKDFNYDYSTQVNESMVNEHNRATISFNTGSSLVTDIEIVFKESGKNNLYLVETLNKAKNTWSNNTTQSFEFSNNKIYKVLPEKELFRLYDNVPLLAKALSVINNRLVLLNYTENYDLIDDADAKVVVDLNVENVSTAITEGSASKSVKSNRDYEVAIAYLDDYGRMTTPLTSKDNTTYIPNANCVTKNQLKVTVANKPPAFAKYFRFFIKQPKEDYDTIVPTLFYQDGVFVWIKLEGGDKDKVKEGDFLYVKADTQAILPTIKQVKVLEVKDQERNFLETTVTTETKQLSGLYFKIKPSGFRLNEGDFFFYDFSGYDNSRNAYDTPIRNNISYIENGVYYGANGLDDLTSSGTYSGLTDIRYLVEILNLAIGSVGSVELTGGASGSVDSITVNAVNIMSSSVPFSVSLAQTAINVAANINAHTSSPNYTAVAVGNFINITSVNVGPGTNGFAVVSTTTTITKTDSNMANGENDTYRWSNTNGASWDDNGGNGYAITGAAQTLESGVQITFGAVTGHDIDDEWVVSAKSSSDNNIATDMGSKAYAIFKGIGADDTEGDPDVIEGGARIMIRYNEYKAATQFVEKPFTASRRYANLEEWFFKDNIQSQIPIDSSRIWFRRGAVGNDGNAKYLQMDTAKEMSMIIRSLGTQNNDADSRATISSYISIFQSEQNIILETKPKETNSDIYYEIGQTYSITGGYHIGNGGSDVNQSSGVDAEILLPIFNCFAWGNGFESYKVKDEFNANTMKLDTRPSTTIENYRKNKRIASYTWSNVYEQTTNYNAINEFNLALVNYNDLDDKNGAIQVAVPWENDLDVWQEDKVIKVLYNDSVLYNSDGTSNLAKSKDLLVNTIPYAGEFGISNNPEGLAVYGNYVYWPDAKRGVILRKGQSGIEVISNFGMRDWFRDQFVSGNIAKVLGCYDPYMGQYVININGYTLTFDEKVKGWTSFFSYLPDGMTRLNNRFFTIKNGQLWKHNNPGSYNMFYGVQYTSKVTTVFAQEPGMDKIFKTIVLEGDNAWKVLLATNYTNGVIEKAEFSQRESRWYAYIRKNENAADLNSVTQGIGNIVSVAGTIITFAQVPNMLSIGDTLYQMNGSTKEIVGVITNKSTTTVTVTTIVTTPVVGRFSFSKKDSRIEGAEIRGYYLEATLEDATNTANELFAVRCNAVRSNLS